MEEPNPRDVCGKIPPHPLKNPYMQKDTPNELFLEGECVNFYDTKLFPYPKYRIMVYEDEPFPPCFYIYCRNTAIAISMVDGKVIRIKKKGRNPRVVKYVIKHLFKWLKQPTAHPFYDYSNWWAIRNEWSHPQYTFSLGGKLMTIEEWKQLPEAQDDFPSPFS